MYESDNANFDDMGCTWNAGHVIGMLFKHRVANRGRKKMVMASEIVHNTTYKTHIKNVRISGHEIKNDLKKLLNLSLIV